MINPFKTKQTAAPEPTLEELESQRAAVEDNIAALAARAAALSAERQAALAEAAARLATERDEEASNIARELASLAAVRGSLSEAAVQALAATERELQAVADRRAQEENARLRTTSYDKWLEATEKAAAIRARAKATIHEFACVTMAGLMAELQQANVAGDLARRQLNAATGESANWDHSTFGMDDLPETAMLRAASLYARGRSNSTIQY